MPAKKVLNPECKYCGDIFATKGLHKRHIRATHPQCPACLKRFQNALDEQLHRKKTGHCFCVDCNLSFTSWDSHVLHLRNINHSPQYICCDCDRDYPGSDCLKKHCCSCDTVYRSNSKLKQHFKAHPAHRLQPKAVRVEPEVNLTYKCSKCEKKFATKGDRKKHRATHKPPRTIPCPVGSQCTKKFATPSALINHLESGRCRAGMTRGTLNELVRRYDPEGYIVNHAIAKPAHLDTGRPK